MSPSDTSEGLRQGRRPAPRLNVTISRVLVIGLVASVALLLVGVVLTVVRPGLAVIHTTSISDLPRALGALEPVGFFDLGLLVLLATPAARVAALLVSFARRRLWIFSGISLLVLVVLALSAFLGLRG
jgi:uncharacterized membrane protein